MEAQPSALADDLEAGRLNVEDARRRAAAIRPDKRVGDEVGRLALTAIEAYGAGMSRRAWAIATVVAAVTESWGKVRSRPWPFRAGLGEGVFDLEARALVLLSLIEADAGRVEQAEDLQRRSGLALDRVSNPGPARLAIATLDAERAIRQGRFGDAVDAMEDAVRLPGLDGAQRAAAQAVLATALRAAGRPVEGMAVLEDSAEAFARAGLPVASLAADLERGVRMLEAGEPSEARSLLTHVAESAAAVGEDEVEADARLRLGALASQGQDHAESEKQFRLAAAAARRQPDEAKALVAIRNAADELRLQHDLDGAERMLREALTVEPTRALEVDLAKAKVVLAIVCEQQGGRRDVGLLLDEAQAMFQHRLDSLEHMEGLRARDDLEAQLRQVAALRARFGLPPG